jgi:hypothetical protein
MYTQVENPRWADESREDILVYVNWDIVGTQDIARLKEDDTSENIVKLRKEILEGVYGEIGEPIAATASEIAEQLERTKLEVRGIRDILLTHEVDPIVSNPLRWADLTSDQQSSWKQYRIDLLNITDQDGFPNNVTWPTKPE